MSKTKKKVFTENSLLDFYEKQIDKYTFADNNPNIIEGKTDEYSYRFYNTDKSKNIYAKIYFIKNKKIKKLILDKKVKSIRFSGDNLEYIPELPDTIEYLELHIDETPKFRYPLPKNLKILILEGSNIDGTLPDLSYLKNLWFLNASRNKIGKIRSSTLPDSLMDIDIRNNLLTKLPNKLPKNLVILSCQDNNIEYLDNLSYLKKLKSVYLGNNKLIKVSSTPPVKGVYVALTQNPIKYKTLSDKWQEHFIRN